MCCVWFAGEVEHATHRSVSWPLRGRAPAAAGGRVANSAIARAKRVEPAILKVSPSL